MHEIFVELDKCVNDSYSITLGSGFIEDALNEYENAFFIADSSVYAYYEELFAGRKVFVFEASENAKSIESFSQILSFFHDKGCRRDGTLVAIGGGITGDIGGFAASAYMRGISYVQVPTTLLSMVDSSVGGKTGINFHSSKNNIGAFYQPKHVYIDTEFLKTLDDDEFLNGIAEVIKYGAIFDSSFFNMLLNEKDLILSRNPDTLKKVISECCKMKAKVVKEDEKEQGVRKLLNFGHTFGHAIETDSQFKIKHGFAVATGMYLENLYGLKEGLCSVSSVEEIAKILDAYCFEKEYEINDSELFFSAMSADKKANKKGLTVILAPEIGKGAIASDIALDKIKDFFG